MSVIAVTWASTGYTTAVSACPLSNGTNTSCSFPATWGDPLTRPVIFGWGQFQTSQTPSKNSYYDWVAPYDLTINSVRLASSQVVGTAPGQNTVGQPAGAGVTAAWELGTTSTAGANAIISDAEFLIRSTLHSTGLLSSWTLASKKLIPGATVGAKWVNLTTHTTAQTPFDVTVNAAASLTSDRLSMLAGDVIRIQLYQANVGTTAPEVPSTVFGNISLYFDVTPVGGPAAISGTISLTGVDASFSAVGTVAAPPAAITGTLTLTGIDASFSAVGTVAAAPIPPAAITGDLSLIGVDASLAAIGTVAAAPTPPAAIIGALSLDGISAAFSAVGTIVNPIPIPDPTAAATEIVIVNASTQAVATFTPRWSFVLEADGALYGLSQDGLETLAGPIEADAEPYLEWGDLPLAPGYKANVSKAYPFISNAGPLHLTATPLPGPSLPPVLIPSRVGEYETERTVNLPRGPEAPAWRFRLGPPAGKAADWSISGLTVLPGRIRKAR